MDEDKKQKAKERALKRYHWMMNDPEHGEQNRQKHRETQRKRYQDKKDDPEFRDRHREIARKAGLKWYHAHKDDPKQVENREHRNEYAREYWDANKDRLNAERNQRRAENREDFREKQNDWAKSNPGRRLLTRAKGRAKKKGIEFSITLDDILPLPTKCPVLGIELRHGTSSDDPNSWSIDRIDNTKGYTPDNVAVISRRANVLKRDATTAELNAIVKWLNNLQN